MQIEGENKTAIYIKRIVFCTTILTCIIICVLFCNKYMNHVNNHNYMRLEGFKNEEPNSIDVVFIGSSDVMTGFAPALAYEKYGFTAFPYAADAATIQLWKTMVKNVLQKQSPKLFVVDVHGAICSGSYSKSCLAPFHYVFDGMPNDTRKSEELKYVHGETEYNESAYLFPFIMYHGFIDQAKIRNTDYIESGKTLYLKGAILNSVVYSPIETPLEIFDSGETVPIPPKAEQYLVDFLEFCKANNLTVLFAAFPTLIEENQGIEGISQMDYVGAVAKKYGYDYVNFQYHTNNIGIDFCRDFYNPGHMNVFGQNKFTLYFGEYLNNKYDFSDTRIDSSTRQLWQESVENYDVAYNYLSSISNGMIIEDSVANYQLIDRLKTEMKE